MSSSALISATFHAGYCRVRKRRKRSRTPAGRRDGCSRANPAAPCRSGTMRPTLRAKCSTTSSSRPRRSSPRPTTRPRQVARLAPGLNPQLLNLFAPTEKLPLSAAAVLRRARADKVVGSFEKTLNSLMHAVDIAPRQPERRLISLGLLSFYCAHGDIARLDHRLRIHFPFFPYDAPYVGLPVPDETLLVFPISDF